jgi:tRNA (adenine22-N1)-methyltransferase
MLYLPIATVLSGEVAYVVAGEVSKGPFEKADFQVSKNKLCDKIEVRFADGLEAICAEDKIDVITIAGMGGSLIVKILERGYQKKLLHGSERLILQPNIGEDSVRYWLMKNGYKISAEEIMEENQKIYEIIVADEGDSCSTDMELFFGPFLLKDKNKIFQKKWKQELVIRKNVLNSLSQAKIPDDKKTDQLQREISWIMEVINHARKNNH